MASASGIVPEVLTTTADAERTFAPLGVAMFGLTDSVGDVPKDPLPQP